MRKDALWLPLLLPADANPPSPCTRRRRHVLPLVVVSLLMAVVWDVLSVPHMVHRWVLAACPTAGQLGLASPSSILLRRPLHPACPSSAVRRICSPTQRGGVRESMPAPSLQFLPARRPRPRAPPAKRSAAPQPPHQSHEVTDEALLDVAADLVRHVTIVFLTHPRSRYYTDKKRRAMPEIRRKQRCPDVEAALPIPLPKDLPGVDLLPSRTAFAIYVRGKPYGVAVVIERMVEHRDHVHLTITLQVEHEYLRHLMTGHRGKTLKQLTAATSQQLSLAYEHRVTATVSVFPVKDWGRHIGGIWGLMPY
eukprot:GGOE01004289.1.p1 GENE.GGOE01004289.1~~GGOE01004289.1.p1  ORF type:complete len:308 (+),score=42.65 GGOE01004289.1:115-1038(+)